MWGHGEPVYYWAENGLVKWEDERDGPLPSHRRRGAMDWRDAAFRVLALSEMTFKSSEGGYRDERMRMQQFICEMEEVIKEAKRQGGPFDDDAGATLREQRRRRAKTYVMPRVLDGRALDSLGPIKGDPKPKQR
jgi:hypothetical protein